MTTDQRREHEAALEHALSTGIAILQKGGNSLDAVEAAVISLEDCPLFNAGKGSVFTRKGDHEMDAAIMDGRTLKAGAIGGITRIKNPIRLARTVMDQGEYAFLAGEKALQLALDYRLPLEDPTYFYTSMRYAQWQQLQTTPAKEKGFGTVGAVAMDHNGHLAAATSTGGLVNKAYGRLGDSCVIGGGTYANNATCAISCTGDGEAFIRAVAAYDVSCLIEYSQMPLEDACQKVLNKVASLGGAGGLIAIHRSGGIVMPFNSEGMYRACRDTSGHITVGIF
jgi:beta-aspartyl-peptidase (threonine type)